MYSTYASWHYTKGPGYWKLYIYAVLSIQRLQVILTGGLLGAICVYTTSLLE